MRALLLPILVALMVVTMLVACSTVPQRPLANCPASIPTPAPLVGKPTPANVGKLEIRVELARERERDRGDCWRAAYEAAK